MVMSTCDVVIAFAAMVDSTIPCLQLKGYSGRFVWADEISSWYGGWALDRRFDEK
jgi:hypothetical protein